MSNAAIRGRRNKATGEYFEKIIERACKYYSDIGVAEIQKTPEPMRVIQRLGNGRFMAVFTKSAQPDYKGTLRGGQAIVFEAKHTDGEKMMQSVITAEQEKRLNKHFELGASCYVLVSFELKEYFFVPWEVFRGMKGIFGRKYIKPDDIREYEVKYSKYLNFLERFSSSEQEKKYFC
ncbi:MAG: Holliday junction resolvase RecU [Firmicutes bacterium]|nr:Holliday junction resolvase RecU [Bacillota bacterium]